MKYRFQFLGAYDKFLSSDESKSSVYGNSKRSEEENSGTYGEMNSSDDAKLMILRSLTFEKKAHTRRADGVCKSRKNREKRKKN